MSARAILALLCLSAGCHSTLEEPEDDLGIDDAAEPDLAPITDDAGNPLDLANCTPVSCIGQCGPIFDPCLGKNAQCGGCMNGQVCDLAQHVCITPKTSCMQLGAGCGITKTSCGKRLDCGTCATGKECDPDTNQCIACQNPTCAELGFQCGKAWLGCGPTSTQTDCGACPAGATPVCNPFFNVCEPKCTPPSATTLCNAAKAARGVQCGIITNGCGGYVDCDLVFGACAAGFACGAQGDPNVCEPFETPVECIAAGVQCGTITSACGGMINCGTCTAPNVCNSNGLCGPPCTPMDCTMLGNPQCGLVPDGCGGMKKCNDCPDAVHYTCINHMCCMKKTCAANYAGMCGTQLDDGCMGTIDCSCASGSCTTSTAGMTGTCCVNSAKCAANQCGSVTDTCTGLPIQCCDPATHYCNSSNVCVPKKTCADYTADGMAGQQCSNGGAFDDGTGKLLSCPCMGGRYCIGGPAPSPVVTGMTIGMCCTDSGACNMGGTQACNTTMTNSCTGGTNTCGNCGSGKFCNSNVCTPLYDCAHYGANGGSGDPCSNGANPAWPTGGGMDLTCPCLGGQCVSGGMVVSGGTQGMCCVNTAVCPAGQCNTSVIDTCTGATIPCNCNGAQYCNGSNVCVNKKSCADYNANGAIGDPCNDNPFFDDGSGIAANAFACPCSPASGFANVMCAGESASMAGTCQCSASTCGSCANDGQSDGCGGTLSCKCGAGTVCFASACCTPKSCGNLPSGVPAGSCGAFADGCGQSFSCGCPANNPSTGLPMPNEMCALISGQTYGACACTPTSCVVLGVGPHANDGCGNPVNCGA